MEKPRQQEDASQPEGVDDPVELRTGRGVVSHQLRQRVNGKHCVDAVLIGLTGGVQFDQRILL